MLVPVQAHPSFSLSFLGLLVVLWCFLARSVRRKAPSVRFPPGPRGDPLIGNARHMPSQFLYIKFHDWAVRYRSSPFSFLEVEHCLLRILQRRFDTPTLIWTVTRGPGLLQGGYRPSGEEGYTVL